MSPYNNNIILGFVAGLLIAWIVEYLLDQWSRRRWAQTQLIELDRSRQLQRLAENEAETWRDKFARLEATQREGSHDSDVVVNENKTLRHELNKRDQLLVAAQRRIAESDVMLESTKENADSLRERVRELLDNTAKYERTIDGLHNELELARAEGKQSDTDEALVKKLRGEVEQYQLSQAQWQMETTDLQEQIVDLRAQLDGALALNNRYAIQVDELQTALQKGSTEVVSAESDLAVAGLATPVVVETEKVTRPARKVTKSSADDLKEIFGIGKVYEAKLNAANIFTFHQLAQVTPETVREIIRPEYWQEIDPARWIQDAAVMAKEREGEV